MKERPAEETPTLLSWEIIAVKNPRQTAPNPSSPGTKNSSASPGKDKTPRRRNSALAELAASVLPPEEEATILAQERDRWYGSFLPVTLEEKMHFDRLILNSVRIRRCDERELAMMTELSRRAVENWDEDRGADIKKMASKLSKSPSLVSHTLSMTTHGCDWLLHHWHKLERVLDRGETWSKEEVQLAGDLMGILPQLRRIEPWRLRHFASPRDMVESEVERLEKRQVDVLAKLDEKDQGYVRQGLELYPSKDLDRLRRYASACRREFYQSAKVLDRCRVITGGRTSS